MKAIIYCRKSTDDHTHQQQSLDIQLEWCMDFAQKHTIKIVEQIVEAKSAFTRKKRDGFARMIQIFQAGKADTLIVYQIDRIARNPIDEGAIKQLVIDRKITRIYSTQGTFEGNQIISLSLFLAMANQYSIDHQFRVKKGIDQKVRSGEISWNPPLGYYIDRNDGGKIKTSDDTRFIQRIFDMKAEGCSLTLITDQMYCEGFRTRKGEKIHRSVINRIIKNPYYYGIISYQGELIEGNHQPIISKKLFDQANGYGRGVFLDYGKIKSVLQGKVWYIDASGERTKMTCSIAKNRYIYLHLHSAINNDKIYLNQQKIIDYFDTHIQDYCIPYEYSDSVKEMIAHKNQVRLSANKDEEKSLKRKIVKIDSHIKGLTNMRIAGELTGEEFLEQKNELVNEKTILQQELITLTMKTSQILDNLNKLVELYVDLKDIRKRCSDEKKLDIINNITVELLYDHEKRLYIAEKSLYKTFRLINVHLVLPTRLELVSEP